MSQTIGLAQACEPGIEFGQGAFEHLPMTGILCRLQLLADSPAGEIKRILFMLPGRLFPRKLLF